MAERLALFAKWTGAQQFPVKSTLEACEGGNTFSDAFLHYCNKNGMSLDWVWLGDERGVVIEAFRNAKGARA